jgi:hypothetical protein
MPCSIEQCKRPYAPIKFEDEQSGEKHQFCSLAHLGAWLLTKLDASARNFVNLLSTSAGRKMAAKFLADRVL